MTTLKKAKTILKTITKNIKTRPLMQNVAIVNGQLLATDFESFLRIKDNFDLKDGMQDVNTLGLKDSIELDADYPLSSFDHATSSVESFKMLASDLEQLLKFCSKDETRLYLNGIAINSGHFVATDGHKMKSVVLEEANNNDAYILPSSSMTTLLKLLKAYKMTQVVLYTGPEFTYINNDFFSLKIRNIQRDYPKWTAVVPTKTTRKMIINNWINFKELKPIFDKRNYKCILELNGKNVILKVDDQEFLIGETTEKMEIGFNASYLDILINKRPEVEFNFNNELSPFITNFNEIVMPVKL